MAYTWGKVLDRFEYDFDGESMEAIKCHPWKTNGCTVQNGDHDESKVTYHCEQLRMASDNLDWLLIAWIAHKNLGLNQTALVEGIAKALGVYKR